MIVKTIYNLFFALASHYWDFVGLIFCRLVTIEFPFNERIGHIYISVLPNFNANTCTYDIIRHVTNFNANTKQNILLV